MKAKTLIPLTIYLLIVGGIGCYRIPTIVGEPSRIFGGLYAGVVLSWFFYWLGIWMTKPRDRKVEVKTSYYYPLCLHTIGCLVYSYILIPVVAYDARWMSMAFVASLVSFALYYCAGMIVAHRDLQGKNVYFTQQALILALLFLVPTIIISVLVSYFSRNNSTGLMIGTIVGIALGAVFFYLGIALASEDGARKTGFYKLLIWLFLYAVPSLATIAILPVGIEIYSGKFFDLWVSFLLILVNFLVLYTIAFVITAKIYQTKPQ